MASYDRTQAPAAEPVSVAECKVALNVDSDLTADDALIEGYIEGAREYAEHHCNSSFVTQKWRLTLDSFQDLSAAANGPFIGAILLEKGPVQSIDTIVYVDMRGQTQTITAPGTPGQTSTAPNESKFVVVYGRKVTKIAPAFGQIWPISQPQLGAVQINFTAGYGDVAVDGTSVVPKGIRNWFKMRVATLYQNREEVAVMPRGKVEALPYVDRLLDPYQLVLA